MSNILKRIGIAILWIGIWQLASVLIGSELLLPSPLETFKALLTLMGTAKFYYSAATSLLRILVGFICGMVVGSIIGIATALSKAIDAFLAPIRYVIKATPVTSFIILVLLWLTTSITPVFIAFLVVLPVAWLNVREGILATDKNLLEMAQVFKLSRTTMLKKIYLPSVKPYITAAITSGLGFAWKSGIAAEVIARPEFSLGGNIYDSRIYLEIPQLFAWTAVVILLSLAIERLLLTLMKKVAG